MTTSESQLTFFVTLRGGQLAKRGRDRSCLAMTSMSSQYRIIAVCTGNICRSPMAELMLAEAFRAERLAGAVVDSAGTTAYEAGRPIDPRAARKLTATTSPRTATWRANGGPNGSPSRELILALDVDHYGWLRQAAPDQRVPGQDPHAPQLRPRRGGQGPAGAGHRGPLVRRPHRLRHHLEPHPGLLPGIVQHVRTELQRQDGQHHGSDNPSRAAGTLYFMSPAPVIIAIDGRSGSGKTTLAIELAARLREHHKVSLFHLEDIYPGLERAGRRDRTLRHHRACAPAPRGDRGMGQLGLGAALRRRGPHHPPGRNRPGGGRRRRRPRRTAPAGRRRSGRTPPTPTAEPGRWPGTARPTNRSGTSGLPRKRSGWRPTTSRPRRCARAQPGGRHRPRRTSCRPSSTSRRSPPPCCPNSPPGAACSCWRNGSRPAPRPRSCLRRSSAVPPTPCGSTPPWTRQDAGPGGRAERSRFSILADDGGRFGQAVRHSSGRTRVSTGQATRDHRRPVLPLARRRVGPPRRSARRRPTRASSPWAGSGTSATSSSAKPAAATSPPPPRTPA